MPRFAHKTLPVILLVTLPLWVSCAPRLIVRSDPTGAEVSVNDKSIGKTPLEVPTHGLGFGKNSYQIRVQKEGYLTYMAEVPTAHMGALQYEIFVSLKKGDDETQRFNRNMGFIIEAQKLILE